MDTSSTTLQSRTFSIASLLILSFVLLFGMASCGGGGGGTTVAPSSNGYYDTGTALVRESDDFTILNVSDLQGMRNGDRFMLISVNEVLLYDGLITGITGDAYTANVDIYQDGVFLSATTATGTFVTASSMVGTLAGTGPGNGSFILTYSLNNSASALSRVAKAWKGPLNGATGDSTDTVISSVGEISRSVGYPTIYLAIAGCIIQPGSTALPISGVNVYSVNMILDNCTDPSVNGTHTGFATTQTVADDVLVLAFSDGVFSGSGILPKK